VNKSRLTRQRLDRLLRAADPVRPVALAEDGVEAALDEIAAAIVARPRRLPDPERSRRLVGSRTALLLGAAVLVIGASVATATVLSARTGRFPTKAERRMGGPGEYLNPAAPDFRTAALQVAADIPYPEGYESWRNFLIKDWTTEDAMISSGALHGWFAASAFCAWVHTWRQARLAGDGAAAAEATQEISKAPSWKAVTDEDPHPDPSVPGDLGSTKYTLFGWMLPYREAVLAGDRSRVDHLLVAGYGDKCWTSDPGWRALLAARRWRGSEKATERLYLQFLARERP
jgi:hypothetical protein